jgi:hypothetical protein
MDWQQAWRPWGKKQGVVTGHFMGLGMLPNPFLVLQPYLVMAYLLPFFILLTDASNNFLSWSILE